MDLKDNNGTTINVGDTVVFNRAGELEMGEVVDFRYSRTNREWDTTTRQYVRVPIIQVRGRRFGSKLSEVKHSCSVMEVTKK